jgi:hypothetical protein
MRACNKTRRHFTEAAREAAALARQRKRDERAQNPDNHALAMVVVRQAGTAPGFGWQIRRFGHIEPVAASAVAFHDPVEAARSGQAALDALKAAAPRR